MSQGSYARAETFGPWHLLLFWLLISLPLAAQKARFVLDPLGKNGKFPTDRIYSMVMGSHGFMWFGTDLGLFRFDGREARWYRHEPGANDGLSSGRVRALFEDEGGRFWVGTTGGLSLMDRMHGRFRRFHEDVLGSNNVRALAADEMGRLWVGTDQGLAYLDGEDFRRLDLDIGVTTLKCDQRGRLWVGTELGGLAYIEKEQVIFIEETTFATITALEPAENGALWVGTDQGLMLLDGAGELRCWVREPGRTGGLPDNLITALALEDGREKLLVGTQAGFFTFREGDFLPHSAEDPEDISRVLRLYLDPSRLLWIATSEGGVRRLDLRVRQFGFYDLSEQHGALTMVADPPHHLWVGTRRGLGHLDTRSGATQWYLTHTVIRGMTRARDGALLLGTDSQLLRFHPGAGRMSEVVLEGHRVWRILQAGEQQFWVGTNHGLVFVDNAKGERRLTEAKAGSDRHLSHRLISSLAHADNGDLLIGTYGGGLNRREADGRIRHFQNNELPNSLSADDVTQVFVDLSSRIWVATLSGGLNLYHPDREAFTKLGTEEGLPDKAVVALEQDGLGRLWVMTAKGLACFDPSTLECYTYYEPDGVSIGGAIPGACVRSAEGYLYFGGGGGLLRFHPNRMLPLHPSPVVITGYRRDSKEVRHFLPGDSRLELGHEDKTLSLNLSLLDYRAPESSRMAYQREDLDDDWVYTDGATTPVSYTLYLRYGGEGRLRIRGRNHHGLETAASLVIAVAPPPWLKWLPLMVVGGLMLLVGLIYLGISVREKRKRKALVEKARLAEQRRELAEQRARVAEQRNEVEQRERRLQEERTAILQEHLEQVSTEIANDLHDGPLAALNGLSFFLRSLAEQNEPLDEALRNVSDKMLPDVCNALRNVCGQLLTPDFKYGLVTELETYADVIERSYAGLTVIRDFPAGSIALGADEQACLYRIFRTLLKNVGQHSRASEVRVDLGQDAEHIRLVIEDNGQGFEVPENWERFRREKHYGMYMAGYFSQSMGGALMVTSRIGSGTRSVVEVPRKSDASGN